MICPRLFVSDHVNDLLYTLVVDVGLDYLFLEFLLLSEPLLCNKLGFLFFDLFGGFAVLGLGRSKDAVEIHRVYYTTLTANLDYLGPSSLPC